jgi:hypothetical protein
MKPLPITATNFVDRLAKVRGCNAFFEAFPENCWDTDNTKELVAYA